MSANNYDPLAAMTSSTHKARGSCCKSACIHCPYGFTLKRFGLKFKLSICVFAVSILQINASTITDNITPVLENETIQQTISGTVSDESGPLPGVNIIVKGTTNGTQTDFDGNYSISVQGSDAILVFSYLGYKSQEITVGSDSEVNVLLESDISGLDEVVVVGYTTRKRGELTGSVSTVSAKDIEDTPNREVAKSLAGRVTGLLVTDRGGYPGSNDVGLLIRGQSTLNNNSPLILIDGVQSGVGTFNQLAPQDIASVSVLKDGAAAIYGNRAANGVILVTTKRGKAGKPKISFSTSYSLSSFSVQPELMNSEQYAIYENEIGAVGRVLNDGTVVDPSGPRYTAEEIADFASGNGTSISFSQLVAIVTKISIHPKTLILFLLV